MFKTTSSCAVSPNTCLEFSLPFCITPPEYECASGGCFRQRDKHNYFEFNNITTHLFRRT
jgi:hypothetical protein